MKKEKKGETTMSKITNEEEALAWVRENGSALRYLPEEFKTAELCLEAARQNG